MHRTNLVPIRGVGGEIASCLPGTGAAHFLEAKAIGMQDGIA